MQAGGSPISSTNMQLLRESKLAQERRGNLPRSVERRMCSLRALARSTGPRTLLDLTREEIEAWLDRRNIGPQTRYAYLSHFSCFYEWAIETGHATVNPVARIQRPKTRRRLPRPAATKDLSKAIDIATPELRAWIMLAAFQGLRCQEIAGLRREDVLESDQLLRVVHGKGSHERLLPLHPDVYEALEHLPMPKYGWVFLRPKGGGYNPMEMSKAFNRGLREVGVDSNAHSLRHWFGSSLYAQSHDLRLVQEMLGHASPATTAIYTAFDRQAAAKAVAGLVINPPRRRAS
jgi:integrase/recombinase XerC